MVEVYLVRNNKGQFFILAAVVLSVLIFSMAFTANYVLSNDPDYHFFDYANMVDRESDAVLDYIVYSDVGTDDLEDFVAVLERDFKDSEVGGNFLFVYGNNSSVTLKNIGVDGVLIGEDEKEQLLKGSGSLVESRIRVAGVGAVIVDQFNSDRTKLILDNPGNSIELRFKNHNYTFPIFDFNQVIFLIEKENDDEVYVEVR